MRLRLGVNIDQAARGVMLPVATAIVLMWSPAAGAPCLSLQGPLVVVSGSLSQEWTYGPPNFGEDPKHDRIASYLVLTLDQPICAGVSGEYGDVRTIQLNYHDGSFNEEWVGRHLTVGGRLFEQVQWSDFLPIVMWVDETRATYRGNGTL